MKALVKAEAREGLWLQDVAEPLIGPDHVLVKIRQTGICGTDLHIWRWDDWARRTIAIPSIIGHEYAGEIVETGRNVAHLFPGQRVSGEGHVVCAHSRAARGGRPHHDPDAGAIGVTLPGAFAEYLALPAANIVVLPDAIDDEIGAILDPLGNAVHAALSFDLAGDDVLITGAGPIGIMAATIARHVGARHVVITDVNADRLALAARIVDAVPVNTALEDLRVVMGRLGVEDGFAVGLEMSGAAPAFNQMVEALAPGGRIAFLGLSPEPMLVDWTRIIFKSLFIKGIYGREMFRTWQKMFGLLQSGLDIRGIITHRLNAAQFSDGFGAMRSGVSGKVVMTWPPEIPGADAAAAHVPAAVGV